MLVAAPAALAQDATWLTNPGSAEFNTAANWTPASVPLGTATFGNSATTALTLTFTGSVNLGGFQFNAGAPAYTFDLTNSPDGVRFNGAGIVNNSSNAPTFNVGDASLLFNFSSTAGNATINTANGLIGFLGNSTPGAAALNVTSTFGGIDFSLTNGPAGDRKISAGSIASLGTVYLGGNELTVGSNNLSTEVSNAISDCGFGGTNCFNTNSGPGSLVKVGTGTLTLSGGNFYSGGTTISGGTIMAAHLDGSDNIDALGTGNVLLDGGTLKAGVSGTLQNAITFNDNKTSVVSAGSQSVVLNGSVSLGVNATAQFGVTGDTGTITLSGAGGPVDLTAALVVAGGTLKDGGNGAITGLTFFTASTTVNAGAVLDFNDSNNQAIRNLAGSGSVVTGTVGGTFLTLYVDNSTSSTFGGVISGPGNVIVQTYNVGPGGTMIFTGNNTYTGGTTICNCSTLQLGDGGTSGSIQGDVVNGGTLAFNRSDSVATPYVFSGSISDEGGSAGKVSLIGSGAVLLSGNNSYSGGTTLSSGTLIIGNSNALGFGDLSMAQGTTLSFDALAAYNVANNISIAGDPIFNVAAGPAQTVSGIISDTDPVNNPGIVEKNGAGTLILSGDNTYSGGTIINAGTLQVTTSNPGVSGSVGVGDVTLNGGAFQTDGSPSLEFSNNFKINTAGGAVDNNGTFLTLSGIISNGNGTTGVLQITDSSGGFGTTALTGANTYSGGTKVIGATLQVNNNSSVGTGLVTLENGLFQVADAILTPTLSFGNNFAINNTSFGSAIDVNGYSLTLSGNITDGNGPGKLTVSDSFGGGVLILTGTNTYSDGTDICNCGTLQLGTTGTMGSIVGAVTNHGRFDIVNADTSGMASIFNDSGLTNFYNATTAGAMTITNRFGGTAAFYDSSTAGGATIINNLGGSTEFGVAFGTDAPRAGTATITNNNFGLTEFNAASTADNAKIITNNGGELDFWDNSTADNATITTNAGGKTYLNDNANGGTARFITSGTGFVDFTESIGPNSDGRITAGSIEGSGSYYIGGGNTLVVGGNNLSTEVGGVIADNNPCGCTTGPGALEKVGAGTLTLSGSNTYTGGTTITAGTLQLGNGVAMTGSILGDVTNNATLAFDRPNTYQFDGVISGSGAVQQNGSGTTILTAVNSYGGGTTINAGKLSVAADANLGASTGALTFNGGTLQFTNSSALTLSNTRAITLQSGGGGFEVTDGNVIINQAIGGSGALTKSGSGFLLLAGTNTYGGGTTISAGTLVIGTGGTTGSITGNVVDNGLLTFNRSNSFSFAGQISGSGGMTKFGAGTLTLTADNTYTNGTVIAAGTLQLGNGGTTGTVASSTLNDGGKLVFNRSNLLTFGAQIFGTGSVTQQGTGTTVLTADNTYSGGTTVAGGNLRINGSVVGAVDVQSGGTLSGTGSVGGLVTVQSGGTLSAGQSPGTFTVGALNLNAGSTSVFELGSAGVVGGASNDLVNVTGNLTLGGTLSVNAPSAGYYRLFDYGTLTSSSFDTINGSSNGTPTVLTNVPNQVNLLIAAAGQRVQFWDGADQTGNGVVNGGAGTWNAANTNWTGAPGQAGINDQWRSSVGVFAGTAGTVTIAGAQAFDTLQFGTTGYVLNAGAGGQLQLAGLSGTGTINTDNGIAATIDAPIVNGSSTSLTKVGGGTLILTGANTYSGGTVISGGTLQLGNGGTTGSIVGNVTDNGIFAINRSDTVTFAGTISGSGAFQQLGTGTTILTADNTYGGGTTIGAGTLQLGNGGATGSIGAGNVINNASLVFDRSNAYTVANAISGTGSLSQIGSSAVFLTGDNTYTGGTIVNSGELSIGASGTGTSGSIVGDVAVAMSAQLWFNRSDNVSFDGSISGSGSVTKFGSGVLTLTNANTYTGGTVISDGTLQLGNGGTTGSLVGNVSFLSSAASLGFNRSDIYVFGGFIDGPGSVSQIGAGKTILTANNTYTGGTTISGGTLQLGNGGTTGSIVGNVTDNGVLAINRSNAVTFAGTISGSGAFQQLGTGTTTLTADNNYTGGTTISAGTLQLGNGGATGSIVGNVLDNGVLVANRSNALALDGVISGTGTFEQRGTGTTTLSGANTYTGATTISGGTLAIAAGGGITSDVTNSAAFNNSGSVTGNVTNSGTFINNAGGIVSGLLTNTAGNTTNAGQLNGGALVNAGTLTNNNLISGDITISGGTILSTGHVINNLTITGVVTNLGVFDNNANGTVSGLLTNASITGITTNAGQLNGGAFVTGGTLTNNNLISGDVRIFSTSVFNTGRVDNNLTIAGAVTNAGIFNNNANGTVSGLLINHNFTSTTTNAGRLNGGALVAGGTLTTTGTILNGLTNNATVNANGGAINGAIVNNANATFNVGGTVTSDGTFTNNSGGTVFAPGTLAIGAGGTYTLQGLLTNSGVVTVASGGQLIATVGGITNNAGGTITVTLGGTVKDDLNNAGLVTNNGAYVANVASNAGPGSIINAGSWTGNVLSNSAFIANNGGWTGNVASNTGIINNNLTWIGTVSNSGNFNNNAGATVSGLLTNTAGATLNNGALNGGAIVSGGIFAGSGTVTNLTVSGGIFSPGNGTPGSSMTITGNLAFQSGALYLVQLNPATSTFANVAGTAVLNGSAGAAFLAGNYVAKQYTILTAAGGVSGTFGSFDTLNIPGGFRASLSYDAKDVFLDLDLALAKYSGLNVNQQNVANALTNFFNATGGIPAVFGTLTSAGLTQASGELATGSQQTTFDAMNLFLGLLTDPFVAGRGDGAVPPAGAPQFAEENDATNAYAANGKARTKSERDAYAAVYRKASIRDTYDQRWSVWSAAYGGSQTTDGNAALGSNNTRSGIGGVAVGADYLLSPRTLAGFAVAGGGTSFSVNGQGTGRSDLFQAGAFVRHTVGAAYISAALAYGWQDVTTDRTVTVAGADLLRANFNANTFSGRAEGGYRFVAPWIGGVGITPYAAGQFTTIDLPAYAEQAIAGVNTFALTYASKSVTDTRSELGIRTDKSYPMQNGILTLRGRAAWAHDFNPDRNIGATFQTLPGASFVVNGAAQASDSALVTASAEMKWLNGFSLAATFEGAFSSVTSSYAGKGVVRYAW